MSDRAQVARAITFFEQCSDMVLLRAALEAEAPRVKRMVGGFLRRSGEDAIPPPADLRGASEAALQAEALATLRATDDFALLQVLTRAIGRRIEALEIVASAEIEPGARARVPAEPKHPARGERLPGTVESTGTVVQVLLDNGEVWRGPASLVEVVR